jgi:hypothetical protein
VKVGGRVDELVTVELSGDGGPRRTPPEILAFLWQGERYQVRSVGLAWSEPRRWWRGEGERTWFQVTAVGSVLPAPRTYEIYLDHRTRDWFLGLVRC